MAIIAEYIWIDGTKPTRKLRSKTKIIHNEPTGTQLDELGQFTLDFFPTWQFDGSSTSQAEGGLSDRLLKPVRIYPDPTRGSDGYLILCEVMNPDGAAHSSNTRAQLRNVLDAGAAQEDSWFGFEQEYTMYDGSRPLGFPSERRFPAAQGPYYCGVGADEVYGRDLVETHMEACIEAGLLIQGINAEVMPGQWEFQMGGPGGDALKASDDLWIGRWLLYRLGEDFGISSTLDPKPVPGDWNGAGMHTNFSTANMRAEGGMKFIISAIEKIGQRVNEHLAAYGAGYEMRLTGHHETCRYDEFKYGVSDRTASVRIPANVEEDGCGYLEDRRPNANADPYEVAMVLLQSVCDLH
ncbi:MAG: glutamine synthetase [Myxococcales bacterium]|nr:glutamine synthetase [Myxococcales bacterium]